MYFFDPGSFQTEGPRLPLAEKIQILKDKLQEADAVVIGAGSGLSTAAGYRYTGERFEKYFSDFEKKYAFHDMYSGGFHPYLTREEFWGFWCRYIWINRYAPIPSDLYQKIYQLVRDKDYFVLTTNVDHCFQRAGFEKHRLFYTQGDYGLFQSSHPHGASAEKTYENYEIIRQMVQAEGYEIDPAGELTVPDKTKIGMTIPTDLIPRCLDDGEPMTMNLRSDDTFVEDEGWHQAADRYHEFLRRHRNLKVLYLELGVGMNTPGIIKFPFWQFTEENPAAFYVCVNQGEAGCRKNIMKRSICLNEDICRVIQDLQKNH